MAREAKAGTTTLDEIVDLDERAAEAIDALTAYRRWLWSVAAAHPEAA